MSLLRAVPGYERVGRSIRVLCLGVKGGRRTIKVGLMSRPWAIYVPPKGPFIHFFFVRARGFLAKGFISPLSAPFSWGHWSTRSWSWLNADAVVFIMSVYSCRCCCLLGADLRRFFALGRGLVHVHVHVRLQFNSPKRWLSPFSFEETLVPL